MIFLLCMQLLFFQDTEVIDEQVWLEPDIALPGFNSREISVRELLRNISREKAVNIVIDEKVDAKVTLQMHDTTVNGLLNFLASVYKLDISNRNGIIYVAPPPPPPKPPIINDITYNDETAEIAFDLMGLDAETFARSVSETSGSNLLPAPGLSANLRGFQASLPLEKGLSMFLQRNSLELTENEGVWVMARPKPPQPQEKEATPESSATAATTSQPATPDLRAEGITFNEAGLLSVRFTKKPITEVIDALAATGQVPMAIHGVPETPISLDLTDVSIDHFFRLLLSGSEFGYMMDQGIYVIGPKEKTSLTDVRVVKLQFLNAEMVEQNLPKEYKEGTAVTIVKELNSLMLTGPADKVATLERLIHEVDQPVAQVLIEVVVVDYNFTDNHNSGVTLTNGDNKILPELDLSLEAFRMGDGGYRVRRLPSNFGLRIKALEKKGEARIISKPHVAALNGHEASIKIGTKQFYRLESEELVGNDNPRVRTSQEIKEVEANIELRITPWVSGNGEVTTVIEPTFTNFQGAISDNIPPPISTRELKSTVRLKDGETIILGGLISSIDNRDDNGVPFINRVPILGALFGERIREKSQSELVVYITPHIYYGTEGSVEFIEEREGLDYQLDVKKQKKGIKAKNPQRESWFKRMFKRPKNKPDGVSVWEEPEEEN